MNNKLIFSSALIFACSSTWLLQSGSSDDERALTEKTAQLSVSKAKKDKKNYPWEKAIDKREKEMYARVIREAQEEEDRERGYIEKALFSKPLPELLADIKKRQEEDFKHLKEVIQENERYQFEKLKNLAAQHGIELQGNNILDECDQEALNLLREKIKAEQETK